jgi:hypothetical protein
MCVRAEEIAMAKLGVGVGEEFPIGEPPRKTPEETEQERAQRRRHWRQHHVLGLITRIAAIALIVSLIVWMFVPHGHVAVADGPRDFYHYGHHYFFPFPLLLILLFVLAWRGFVRHGHRHWHRHGPRHDHHGEA